MRVNLFRVLLFAALLEAGAAQAQGQAVGRVLLAAGDVFAVRNGQPVRLQYNSPVEFKDVLRTGPSSSLQVRFVDEGLVSLRENSEFAIEEYRFAQAKPDEERAFFRLIKGGFRSVTGLIGRARHASYRVQTQTATIGIRGTDYAARLCLAGECGANVKDGLYGTVLGMSSGTNQITVQNEGTPQPVVFGIGQNFFVPDAKSAPQQLLQPPTFVSFRPQGKAQAAQQGGQGSGGEQASGSSGTSADSRAQAPGGPATSPILLASDTPFTVTSTLTSSGSSALLPGVDTGVFGYWVSPGIHSEPEGGAALVNQSVLQLGTSGIPSGFTIPAGCSGPNSGSCDGITASLGAPVQASGAHPNNSTQTIFWGRWDTGTINDGGQVFNLGATNQAHLMYGPLTPAEVMAAKTGTLVITNNVLGTTPTNNLGETGSFSPLSIQVDFSNRSASMAGGSATFSSQSWSLPSGSGPLTVAPGQGAYFLIEGSGGSCSGSGGCSGAVQTKAAGIFLGPGGDHAGVTLSGLSAGGASFGAVRLFCPSGC